MKLVVDTNILFTFFWENSFSRSILLDESMEFFAPELALKEINEYQGEVYSGVKQYQWFKENVGCEL